MTHERMLIVALNKFFNQLIRTMEKTKSRVNVNSAARGITKMQVWIIGYLSEQTEKEEVFQKDIEEEFNIRRPTATKILQLMEKKKLITREVCDYDARKKKICLTPKAVEVFEFIQVEVTDAEKKMSRNLSYEEIESFIRTIEKMNRNLKEEG